MTENIKRTIRVTDDDVEGMRRYPYSTEIDDETIAMYQQTKQWLLDNGIAIVSFSMVFDHYNSHKTAYFTPDNTAKIRQWYEVDEVYTG